MNFNHDLKTGGNDGPGADAFIKLKDGESVQGALRGEPYVFYIHWVDKRSHLCLKNMGISADCEYCKNGLKIKTRFRMNMIVKSEDGYEAKILEQGPVLYEDLKALHSEWDLSKTIIKITRTGSGLNDTRYSVVPTKHQVTPDLEAKFSSVALHELKHTDELSQKAEQGGNNLHDAPPVHAYDEPAFTESDLPF